MGEHKRDMQEIRGEVEKLKGDLKGLMKSISEISRSEAGDAKQIAEGEIQSVMQQINQRYQELRLQGGDLAVKARDKVEERPVASMLVALAAGALLGGIVSRK